MNEQMKPYVPSPEEIKNAEAQMTPEQKELTMDKMRKTNAVLDESILELEEQARGMKELEEMGVMAWGPDSKDMEVALEKLKLIREENSKYLEENK